MYDNPPLRLLIILTVDIEKVDKKVHPRHAYQGGRKFNL